MAPLMVVDILPRGLRWTPRFKYSVYAAFGLCFSPSCHVTHDTWLIYVYLIKNGRSVRSFIRCKLF